jgi:hypothetical protein
MKKIQLILLSCIVLATSCRQEIKFDQNSDIDHILKDNINEYTAQELKNLPSGFVLILKRKIKNDTLEFILSTTSSVGVFVDDSVYFHTFYMNQNIFSNYTNSCFVDSCNLKDALEYLNKDEVRKYMQTNEIPPPNRLWTIGNLRLVFYKNKLIAKSYFY